MSDLWEDNEEEKEEVKPRPARRRRLPKSDQRGSWYLLSGLVIGLGLGLLFSWVISPIKYIDNEPASLSAGYKDDYRRVIALAYAADHDLGRARGRLDLLKADNPVQALAAQAQRMLAENQPAQEERALALLAADLARLPSATGGAPTTQAVAAVTNAGAQTPAAMTLETTPTAPLDTATPDTSSAVQTPTLPLPTHMPTPTTTPPPTFTPRPTATAIHLDTPFNLKSKHEVCDGSIQPGLLQILVSGADGKPLPGVRISITWKDGEDFFYSGLMPEINPGYADFQMDKNVSYNLRVGEVSDQVKNLTVPSCGGGWKIEYQEQASGQ